MFASDRWELRRISATLIPVIASTDDETSG
jgi:hypothetical protein